MARRRKKSGGRSGFLFIFIVLIGLSAVIYLNREKFFVLYNTVYAGCKDYIAKLGFGKKNTDTKATDSKVVKEIDNSEKKAEPKIENGESPIPPKKTEKREIKEPQKETVKKEAITKEEKDKIVMELRKELEKEMQRKLDRIEEASKNEIDKLKKAAVTSRNTPSRNSTAQAKPQTHEKPKPASNTKPQSPAENQYKKRESIIYFSKYIDDNNQVLIPRKKIIKYTDAPLRETVKALLNGPDSSDSNLISNVPDGTALKDIWVKNGIAYISLSKNFEYNRYGRESALNQLKQIVYTVTEFSNVKSVQFMIDGQIKTYLGGDGIMIGKPLTRNDFS